MGRTHAVLVAAALAGCAGRTEKPAAGPDAEAAGKIYRAAEARVQVGAHEDAVRLLRHAILQLPETRHYDAQRHALVLRLAYVHLLAWSTTGKPSHLTAAQTMLERYLAAHEGLFGESEPAKAERGEVYEILYVVESNLEAAQEASVAAENQTPPAKAIARAPEPREHEPASAEAPLADVEDDHVDGPTRRIVRVKTSRLASLDDPRVMERLRSNFSDADAGLVLTKSGLALMHGPRPLVRASGLAQAPAADASGAERRQARKRGFELVQRARIDLRSCYAGTFARTVEPVLHGTIEVDVAADGSVRKARIIEGGLDGLGDVCVIEALEGTRLPHDAVAVTLRLPLVFFHEGAVHMFEATGKSAGEAHLDTLDPTHDVGGPKGGPSIERGNSILGPVR